MLIIGIVIGIGAIGAIYLFSGSNIFSDAEREAVNGDEAAHAEITQLAFAVLEYISDDDFNALSQLIHPEYGVVFSPYATINLETDRRFYVEQVADLNMNTSVYMWGVRSECGEPIRLTPAEYFDEFVQAYEHLNAPIVGINKIVRTGNALENIAEVFPNVEFIDFHIPGDENGDGHDWRSLRVGFKEYDGYLKLVSIVHSTWTA